MKIHTYEICVSEEYLILRGLNPSDCLFFDIETTGFRAASSHLYLIGAACRLPGERSRGAFLWRITQWFGERPQEETALLRSFADFIKPYGTVVHFNGNRFDLPYLEEKYGQYGLPSPFEEKTSVDLYLEFRPLRKFLNLKHMNQKSLESFLGLGRDDQYDGGRLIPVYREFCKTQDAEKLELLLLHNKEDVAGMLSLPSLYGYLYFLQSEEVQISPDLLSEEASFPSRDPDHSVSPPRKELRSVVLIQAEKISSGTGRRDLLFTFRLEAPVPVPVSKPLEVGYFTLNNALGKLLLPLREDTLYYYFSDYKNYYYLPEEDQAVHKSVAAYVDKQFRQQAKAETCYIRQEGLFLPQPEEVLSPALRRSLKDPYTWVLWDDSLLTDASRLSAFLLAWLREVK